MGTTSPRGSFIAFEGGEACGKSTQSRLLADALDALLTREPGGTLIGARVRELVLSPGTVGLDARARVLHHPQAGGREGGGWWWWGGGGWWW